jgi:hypothetical protein
MKSPGLNPTSSEAGGMTHDADLAMTAPGTAPGFDGGTMNYPVSVDLAPDPFSGPQIPVSNMADRVDSNPAAAGQVDAGHGAWPPGEFSRPGAPRGGMWKPSPAAGTDVQ